MNILLLSNSSSFHQLAQLLEKDDRVSHIYHYGANIKNLASTKYHPEYVELPYVTPIDTQVQYILNEINHLKFDIVAASGFPLVKSKVLRDYINITKTPCLFPSPELTALEANRKLTKSMLEKLDIPFSQGVSISGWSLFRDFFKIKLPYVIKLESKFMHGRQTLIVTEENLEDVFYKLFGKYSNKEITQYAIEFSDTAIIENYIDINYEISYHAIMNKTSWKYLGSARDYKHQYENDLGELSDSMGAYYVKDVISQIHDYAEKIHKHLCSINRPYQGIMFLGIAVSKDGIPYVLEINTRPGDPEIVPIALGVKNFLDVITETARNNEIPDIIHSNVESVSVSVNNTDLNWNNTATDLPNISNLPKDILFGLDGSFTTRSKHSLLSTTGPTRENAANKIFNFLKTQDLGQFYFRKDIGILK